VQAFADGLLSVFGHDPVIGIKEFSGEVEFVPDTFENASVSLTINAASMSVVSAVSRKDQLEIERTMRAEVLETDKYPEIVFRSTSVAVSRLGEGRHRARVIGDLALHGVTQSNLWINGTIFVGADGLRLKGEFSVRQSDYKIKLVSVAAGVLKIKNEVKCSFDIVTRKA
ncbi:MAG TPA: YceI family protein, partial [Pyrinomonadaceae bacterium]|nr:YceI family protein [Pyrinomonadaceae bacterium]